MTPKTVRVNLYVPEGMFEEVEQLVEQGKSTALTVPEFFRTAVGKMITECKTAVV